ncbi:MAG: TRAP transporter substrate-binding protein DctP [Pseudomonadota bacterium]
MRMLALAAAISIVPSLGFAACDQGEVRIRIAATASPQTVVRDRPARGLADTLDRELQGSACAELGDGDLSSLGTSAQMALPSVSQLSERATAWRVFDVPFAFRGVPAVERFRRAAANGDLQASASGAGAVPLGLLHAGMSHFAVRRPLVEVGELTGRKIALDGSRYGAAFLSAAGAPPQRVPPAEWESALADGRLDGVSMGWQQLAGLTDKTVVTDVLATAHRYNGYVIVAATDWWRAQPEALREQISAIVARAVTEANAFQETQLASARRSVLRGKTTVRAPTRKQRDAWAALAEQAVAASVSEIPIVDLASQLKAANTYP